MNLTQMTMEELERLNSAVVEEIKHRRSQRDFEALKTINIGDTVRFDSGKRGVITMLVKAIRGKMLHGEANYGMLWKVPAGLVTIVSKGAH